MIKLLFIVILICICMDGFMINPAVIIKNETLLRENREVGQWNKKKLPEELGFSNVVINDICEDICCSISDCLFTQNYSAKIHYENDITLLIFGIEGLSQFNYLGEKNKCVIRAGDIWLFTISENTLCRETSAYTHNKMLVIKYETDRLRTAFKDSDEMQLLSYENQMVRLAKQEPIMNWLQGLIDNPMKNVADRLLAEAEALQVLARWLTPNENLKKTIQDNKIQKVIDILISDISTPPTLIKLAAMVEISHSCLNRKFKQELGLTVFDWLRGYRLKRAKQYLVDFKRAITDIALLCGFSSASHFSQLFKQKFSLSPREYRLQRINSSW